MRKFKALYTNLPIKYKLFVLFFVMLAVVTSVSSVMQQYAFGIYDEKVYQQSAKALSLSSVGIENELDKISQLGFTIATDSTIQKYLSAIRSGGSQYDNYVIMRNIKDRIVDLGGLGKYIQSVQIYDVNRTEYAAGNQSITMKNERLNRIISASAQNKGGNTWVSADEFDDSLTAAREIRSYQNIELENLGILTIRVDTNKMFSDYTAGDSSQHTSMIIVQGDKVIYPDDTTVAAETLQHMNDGGRGYQMMPHEGRQYFVAHVKSAKMGWTYYTLLPFDDIFQSIVQVKNTIIIAFIILIALSILFSLRFAKQLTKPIESLNMKMKRVQLGNFENTDVASTPELAMDEVGQMHRNFRIMLDRINELIQENYVKQLAIKDTQFKALQAQINPHFLYNTLETINWSAKMSRQTQISQMVEALGSLLRTSISIKEPIIPLSKELEIISYYITIQNFRFEERLDFHLEIPDELLYCGIPKLSLQPLIENAVNYGLEQMIDTCVIQVSAELQEDFLFISVQDNGPGMKQQYADQLLSGEAKTKGTGLGLKNIEERIKLLYGDAYGMTVVSAINAGTKVSLKLPYEMRDHLG
ncbi:histidine kinase [Paenibacillus sp. NEAU-GSW1]|uniref:sensor histidine kinase n=1 Tax=Paenibacillus sp. NEAU-GSW1 TaxID=2682486 RepID=UPI0012E29C92|nr:histidine kinase [Paenibacillus sp. NEAU-GSW1]MUT67335.1 HAMP domain-containing protein [Paenibacillus sp. NEAU-GSW1]